MKYMKNRLFLLAALGFLTSFMQPNTVLGQTASVSGACMTGTINLVDGPIVNGKPTYIGTGTVAGNAGVQVSIQWLGPPDNVWVLQFDGQPYFFSTFQGDKPISTTSGTWTNLDPTNCPNTTPLSITGSGVIPIELTFLMAQMDKHKTLLTWQTASESNNRGYEIQRSTSGKDWQYLDFVEGFGTSATTQNYQYTDNKPFAGINYYRLKQMDYNGAFMFSKAVSVKNTKDFSYQISPNPSKGLFIVKTNPDKNTPLSINVFDLLGRVIITQTTVVSEKTFDISAYHAGTYIIEMLYDNEVYRSKLIKN